MTSFQGVHTQSDPKQEGISTLPSGFSPANGSTYFNDSFGTELSSVEISCPPLKPFEVFEQAEGGWVTDDTFQRNVWLQPKYNTSSSSSILPSYQIDQLWLPNKNQPPSNSITKTCGPSPTLTGLTAKERLRPCSGRNELFQSDHTFLGFLRQTSAVGLELSKSRQQENQIKPVSKRIKLDQETRLCEECAMLDFEKIFNDADVFFSQATSNRTRRTSKWTWTSDGFYVAALGNRLAPRSACLLCRLFWTMKIGGRDLDKYELRAFSSLRSSYFIQPAFIPASKRSVAQKAFLAVVPTQQLYMPEEKWRSVRTLFRATSPGAQLDGIWGKEVRECADFSIVCEWLLFCQKNHRGTCIRPRSRQILDLRGFRLIDCDSNPPKVERGTGLEMYVALSYVWGSHSGDTDST